MSNADDFQERIASASRGLRGGIVVDCAELTFIDSYGMKALIGMQRALAAEGRTFRVTNASPTFRRICDATGLIYVFRRQDVEPAISEAVGG
jgi:anti-anti-sigma factor